MEQQFTAGVQDAGQRLDTWLCQRLPALSRKQVKALLDSGKVQINGRRVVIAGWELTADDEVVVRIPEGLEREEAGAEGASQPSAPQRGQRQGERPERQGKRREVGASIDRYLQRRNERGKRGRDKNRQAEEPPFRVKVYYEDRDVIVVEKPGGMLSVPREGQDEKGTLIAHVRGYLRRRYQKGKQSFVAPLHRLDAETSGIMVFALSKVGQQLTNQFKNHSIQRSYEAVVLGAMPKEQGVIDRPLEKGAFGGGRKVREAETESETAKRAITEYRVKERYRDSSLLDVSVRTGRTHQIRVHLAAEGFPVLGDALYAELAQSGHEAVMDEVDKHLGFKRHALHAAVLGFKHPASGKKIHYRSPMPQDLKDLIDALRMTAG